MNRIASLLACLFLIACGQVVVAEDSEVNVGETSISVTVTGQIPDDATCAHIVATRLSDFQTAQYRGPLAGASFKAFKGSSRITATAYPLPCDEEPAEPPWIADPVIVTLKGGVNVIRLSFKANARIVIEPEFEIDSTLVIHEDTRILTGRSGEDIAAPNFAVDGYRITQITPPPSGGGPVSETILFSIESTTTLIGIPRGLAHTPSGLFVVQVGLPVPPMDVYDSSGNYVESWPVVTPPGFVQWGDYSAGDGDYSDGLEAIDETHFLRCGFRFEPLCDETRCITGGIDILERQVQPGGGSNLVVVQQVIMPESFGSDSCLGVAPLPNGNIAMSKLAGDGFSSPQLVVLAPDSSIVAGPVDALGLEGLMVTADNRIIGADFTGTFASYDFDLTSRPAETGSLQYGAGVSLPHSLAWDRNTDTFLALSATPAVHLQRADATFTTGSTVAIDLSGYAQFNPSSFDVRANTNQVLINGGELLFDPDQPQITGYNLTTGFADPPIFLQGMPSPNRIRSIAFIDSTNQIAVNSVLGPNNPNRSKVFVYNLDGTQAYQFDVAGFGFRSVQKVSYDATTDELLMVTFDETGAQRILVTDLAGNPRRSYVTDPFGVVADLAPISSGANAGELGLIGRDPAIFARAAAPR